MFYVWAHLKVVFYGAYRNHNNMQDLFSYMTFFGFEGLYTKSL